MPHCDPEVLSLVALGEQASDDDLSHLAGCPDCRTDVDRLRDVVGTLRVDDVLGDLGDLATVAPVAPPPHVWAGIAAATGVSTAPRAPAVTRAVPSEPEREIAQPLPFRRDRGARPRPGRPRPGGPGRGLLLAVAASTLVLGAAGGSGVTWQLTRPDPQPQALVLSSTTLGALPAAPAASGTAAVVETADGPRLRVQVSDVQPLDGEYYEVWLIDKAVQRMVPVGILRGTSAEFTIPPGLDLTDYAVVDISIEAPGDPKHSGKSVLRGVIQA